MVGNKLGLKTRAVMVKGICLSQVDFQSFWLFGRCATGSKVQAPMRRRLLYNYHYTYYEKNYDEKCCYENCFCCLSHNEIKHAEN